MTYPRSQAALALSLLACGALAAQEARRDALGDPLPPSAVARVGSVRWWVGYERESPLVFAPDGKRLYTVEGGAVVALDAATGAEVRRFRKGSEVTTFTLSPDGKTLVTAHLATGSPLRVWGAATGQELRTLPAGRGIASALAFSADGKALAASDGEFILWDAATWAETRRFRGDSYRVGSLFVAPGGRELISGGGTSDAVRWWDVASGKELRAAHTGRLMSRAPARLAFSADGSKIAAMTGKNSIGVWAVATGKVAGGVRMERDRLGWVFALSPDGKTLACADAFFTRPNQLLIHDSATGKELRRWDADINTTHLAYSPDGKVLAEASSGVLRARDAETGRPAVAQAALPMLPQSLRFGPDGRLSVCFFSHGVGAWEARSGRPLAAPVAPPKEYDGRKVSPFALSVSPDGARATSFDEGGVVVWAVASARPLFRVAGASSARRIPEFLASGELVVRHDDGVVRLHDGATGEVRRPVAGLKLDRPKQEWAVSADGRAVAAATATGDGVTVRDTATGKELGRATWDDNTPLAGIRLSADGRTLVTAHGPTVRGGEGDAGRPSARVWDVAAGHEMSRAATSPWFDVRFSALSPDGRTLAMVDEGYAVTLRESRTGAPRGRLAGRRFDVNHLAFSPDGRLLASGSHDQTVLVWDVTGVCPDGNWSPRDADAKELERLWADLADKDATRAYRAMWSLASARGAPAFLAARVQPVAALDEARCKKLIAGLDADGFEERRRAAAELEKLGELAEPAVKQALAAKPTAEARRQLEATLKALAKSARSPEALRALRAVEALEHAGTAEAAKALATIAAGAPMARLTQEAAAALARLARGK